MSKKSSPAVIGGFVVGAVVLLAGGIALFGGAELFAKRDVYVAYFEERTNGLRVGANVLMNGVRVGYVSDIALLVDESTYDTTTRVTLEILPDTYIQTRNGVPVSEGLRATIDHDQLVYDAGLRAQLEIESFVTGQLLVGLELRPETEAVIRGADAQYPEIPTISSNIAQLLANVQSWVSEVRADFDVAAFGRRIGNILEGLDELTNSSDLRESLAGLNSIVNDQATQELAVSMQTTLEDLQAAIADAGSLFRGTEENIDLLTADLKPSLEQLGSALKEAELALAAAKTQLRGDSVQAQQLESTLEEIEGAARTLQNFFDYLERNPEALLRGKQP